MDYSKVAASKPKQRQNVKHTQAHKKSEEQDKLLEFIQSRNKHFKQSINKTDQWSSSQFAYRSNARNVPISRKINQDIVTFGYSSRSFDHSKVENETDEKRRERLRNILSNYASPFIWRPLHVKPVEKHETAISRLEDKDHEIVDERKFKWRNFILQLVLSYELYQVNKIAEALEKLNCLERTVLEEANRREWMFITIEDAVWHVIYTSKAFLLLETDLDQAEKLIETILPIRCMRRPAKAGIYGITAAVFMEYGHKGNVEALKQAMEAVKLDRTCAEWHFLVGKCMGRVRRVSQCHEVLSTEERIAFNKACELDSDNPLYLVYLAQAIRERAHRLWKISNAKENSKKYKATENAYIASKFKYKKAIEMRPNCPHILMRCAYGLMKMSYHQVDLKLARECIDKAITLAPNNMMAHHIKGLYLERFETEVDEAIAEVKQAADLGNFGAAMDLVRINYRLKGDRMVEELEELADRFGEPCVVQVAYTQAGSYLLFIKYDLLEALKYFNKVIAIDLHSYAMKSHKSLFLRMKGPVNLFDVLLEELDTNTAWESFSTDERKVLRTFRIKASVHDKPDKKGERLTVKKIVEMSRNQFEIDEETKVKVKNKLASKERNRGRHAIRMALRGKKNCETKKVDKNNEKVTGDTRKCSKNRCIDRPSRERTRATMNRDSSARTSSISSVCTVDSDYQRDSTVHGERGFFLDNDSTNTCEITTKQTFSENKDRFAQVMVESNTLSCPVWQNHLSPAQSAHSRDSSVSSSFSERGTRDSSNDMEMRRAAHSSRLSQRDRDSNKESKLTIENLKAFDSSYQWTQKKSSIASSSQSDSNSLSVMDRVKQSYAMLSYKNNGNGKKNFERSESAQSLNRHKPNKWNTETNKKTPERSDSVQSLNIESNSKRGLTSKYASRDSSVESAHSCSFMPTFPSKDCGTKSEQHSSSYSSVRSARSCSFMPSFAKGSDLK